VEGGSPENWEKVKLSDPESSFILGFLLLVTAHYWGFSTYIAMVNCMQHSELVFLRSISKGKKKVANFCTVGTYSFGKKGEKIRF
jgi:hypothetical protein